MAGQRSSRGNTRTYPTKHQFLQDPAALARYIPSAWRKLAAAGSAAAMFFAGGVSGCSDTAPRTPTTTNPATAATAASGVKGRVVPTAAVVAPLFNHGQGRAAEGCIVIAPPVFVSEEEALQIIREELGKYGLNMSQTSVTLKEVVIEPGELEGPDRNDPRRKELEEQMRASVGAKKTQAQPLQADLGDAQRHVAVEFVSQDDYFQLGGEISASTVQVYDFKKVARSVAARVRQQGKGVYFGAFYDPVAHIDLQEISKRIGNDAQGAIQAMKEASAECAKAAKEDLRRQVQDFAAWLKAQGAI